MRLESVCGGIYKPLRNAAQCFTAQSYMYLHLLRAGESRYILMCLLVLRMPTSRFFILLYVI